MAKTIKWHRIIGTALLDMFTNSSLEVELEKDLSARKPLLDIVVIKKGKGKLPDNMPDGFEDLAKYNLITYKSMHESLNAWALNEFVGHFVNYRKQLADEGKPLPPENLFKLFAISTRFPQKLDSRFKLIPQSEGLYKILWGSCDITIIVLNQVPKKEHNALWNVFSAETERMAYGSQHYKIRSEETSRILRQIFEKYKQEGINMSYTMEDFKHEAALVELSKMSIDERLEGLSAEEIAQKLPTEERLKGLPVKEVVQRFSVKEIAQGLPVEEIKELKAYLEQLESNKSNSEEK